MAKIKISELETKAPKKLSKEKIKAETEQMKIKIGNLQNLLYAEGKHALLIIFQGMDASGKDGAIKNSLSEINPAGCRVISFKKPTELELKHDFLWRIHANTPEKGMIHVFNRSHYEDVLIVRVHDWINDETARQRFNQINNFEKMLTENGTIILKFFLNVSQKEQLERLNDRLKDPTKKWKYNASDMEERKLWGKYMKCYEDVLQYGSSTVEWVVVPADQNWYKEYVIVKKILKTLENLKMKYPQLPSER